MTKRPLGPGIACQPVEDPERAGQVMNMLLKRLEHGIRGSLTTIMGAHELALSMDQGEAHLHELLKLADHACENLLSTVNGVMDQISLESGEFALEETRFNLYELTEQTVRKMRFAAREQDQELHVVIDPSIEPMVWGDQERLRQALVNLLADVLVCAAHGGVVLALEKTGQQDMYRFAARIDHSGTCREGIAAIQRALHEGPIQTGRFVPGLGLPLCKPIIQAMGGEISVQPQSGDGATVSFTAHLPPGRQETGLMAFREHMAQVKALIMDDNFAQRHVLCESLTALGLNYDVAENLDHARQRLSEAATAGTPYDLAVVGQRVPDRLGMDISGIAASLLVDPSRPAPALIMVLSSARSGKEEALRRDLPEGTMGLHWPFSLARVSDAIIKTLGLTLAPVTATGAACPPSPLKILLADSDPASRVVLRTHLEHCSGGMDLVGTGLEAFERFAVNDYDLVVLETDMPEMSGFEAVRLMRELEEEKQQRPTPILAITTRLSGPRRELALDSGVDAILLKPFTRAKLMRVVNDLVLRGRKAIE